MAKGEQKTSSIRLEAHGDGTYHTSNGHYGPEGEQRTEHPAMGHALMHIAQRHSQGDHVHIAMNEDGSYTTHHVAEGGRVRGPNEHKSFRDLMAHLKTIDEEGADD